METIIPVREKKMGTARAAKAFNDLRTTLQTLNKKCEVTPFKSSRSKHGRKPYLAPKLKDNLVSYQLTTEQKFLDAPSGT